MIKIDCDASFDLCQTGCHARRQALANPHRLRVVAALADLKTRIIAIEKVLKEVE